MRENPKPFGVIPDTWYSGYMASYDVGTCQCSAHVYERQRRMLEAHVRTRGKNNV